MNQIPKVDKETLQRFRDEAKTLKEASEHFGVAYGSMTYWCKRYGIVFRGNGGQEAAAKERAANKEKQEPKLQEEPETEKPTKLSELYRQVVQIRFHQRRLAYKEKQLLQAISEILGGSISNE